MNCVIKKRENIILVEVRAEYLYQLLAVNLQKIIIEFICHCEQNRALLKLIMKHVKAYM